MGGSVMLSHSLTSCLIKPLANDFVPVINSICSLKRSVDIELHTLLGTEWGLSWYLVIEVSNVFPSAHVGSCELQGDRWSQGRWAPAFSSLFNDEVFVLIGRKRKDVVQLDVDTESK